MDINLSHIASELQSKVGLSQAYASQLATGRRSPSLALAVKIEERLGIPPRFWVRRDLASGDPAPSYPSSSSIVGAPALFDAGSSHVALPQNTRIDGAFSGRVKEELAAGELAVLG
jgi:transcriptional regulator with XRE-family HTH domain